MRTARIAGMVCRATIHALTRVKEFHGRSLSCDWPSETQFLILPACVHCTLLGMLRDPWSMEPQSAKLESLNSVVQSLLRDPLLADVPPDPELRDVELLVAHELGSAMSLTVTRGDGHSVGCACRAPPRSITVITLRTHAHTQG